MKKIFSIFCFLCLVALVACDSNPSGPSSGGLGTGGENNGGVSIQVQGAVNGTVYIFSLKPSANITLTTVSPSVPAANYTEDFDFTGQGEWTANTFGGFLQYDANVIQTGQAWSFKFVGKTTDDNKDFTVTANYTIP